MNETTKEERNVKRCPTCGKDKPLDQFGRNRARKDGVQSCCKACASAKQKAKYQPKKPAIKMGWRMAALISDGKRKICRRCGTAKALDRFDANSTKSDGKQNYCRSCMSKMNRNGYRNRTEREKLASVAGKMLPWQAAEALGVSEAMLHYLAQKHGISVAFVKPRWTPENVSELLSLRQQGLTHKAIAERTGRTPSAVRMKLKELRDR